MLKNARRAASVTSALLLAAAASMTTASAATAHPMTASNCGDNYGFTTCLYVQGSGYYVSELHGYETNYENANGELIHVQVVGPTGTTLCNSATIDINGNNSTGCYDYPNTDMPGGNYCAITWQYNGNGGYYNDGENCVNVFG